LGRQETLLIKSVQSSNCSNFRIDFEEATFDAEIAPESFALAPPSGSRRVRRFVAPAEEVAEESTAKEAKDAKEEGDVGGTSESKEPSDEGDDQ